MSEPPKEDYEAAREQLAKMGREAMGTNPKDLIGVTKPQLWLVPAAGNIYEADVFKLGAAKYGPYNWRKNKVRMSVYLSAILRHYYQMLDGAWVDAESGLPHAAHIRANTNIILDAKATGNLIDDVGLDGPAGRLIEELTKKAS